MTTRYSSFAEFYPFYLSQHRHPTCRRLHFLGSWLVIALVVVALATKNPWWLALAPVLAYGCAWIGHFAFEKNRPATFTYPLWSLVGDWVMFGDMLVGRASRFRRSPPRRGR